MGKVKGLSRTGRWSQNRHRADRYSAGNDVVGDLSGLCAVSGWCSGHCVTTL